MNIVCISTSEIPSDTANSIQVMKTCQALGQVDHTVTLLAPGRQSHPLGTAGGPLWTGGALPNPMVARQPQAAAV